METVEREQIIPKIGFVEGQISTMELYAIWKDGARFLGVMREPLQEALAPYKKELIRLTEMLHGTPPA